MGVYLYREKNEKRRIDREAGGEHGGKSANWTPEGANHALAPKGGKRYIDRGTRLPMVKKL